MTKFGGTCLLFGEKCRIGRGKPAEGDGQSAEVESCPVKMIEIRHRPMI